MTTREDIQSAIAGLTAQSGGQIPLAPLDEAPKRWIEVSHQPVGELQAWHMAAVQDSPPPDVLGVSRGAEGQKLYELEIEPVFFYGAAADIGSGGTLEDARVMRRALREQAIERFNALIAANRTLGLGDEVWAEVGPPARSDMEHESRPAATVLIPVRVLYTATSAAG